MTFTIYTLLALFAFFIFGLVFMYRLGHREGYDEGSVVTLEELYKVDAFKPREEWKPFEEEE